MRASSSPTTQIAALTRAQRRAPAGDGQHPAAGLDGTTKSERWGCMSEHTRTTRCKARPALALDLLHELREGAEIHLHNRKICKNEEWQNNWTGKLDRIDAILADHSRRILL